MKVVVGDASVTLAFARIRLLTSSLSSSFARRGRVERHVSGGSERRELDGALCCRELFCDIDGMLIHVLRRERP